MATNSELIRRFGKPNQIPQVPVRSEADIFENAIRKFGVVSACEWFGCHTEDDFAIIAIEALLAPDAAFSLDGGIPPSDFN